MSLRKGSYLPTTQCACVDFVDLATQRNGSGGHEKDLLALNSGVNALNALHACNATNQVSIQCTLCQRPLFKKN
jgi:hypothetical protein